MTFNDTRYSHIIDPRTGYPSIGIISVTVFAPKAELADALTTFIFVMGVEVGLSRVSQLPKIECIIIDDKGQVYTSEKIHNTIISDGNATIMCGGERISNGQHQ